MSVTENGPSRAAEKARYIHDADLKYRELTEKYGVIKEKIKFAIDNDNLDMNEQLPMVQHQAETQLATVQRRLERLNGASNDSWPVHKRHLETGWEDLLHSIKNLVTRISWPE